MKAEQLELSAGVTIQPWTRRLKALSSLLDIAGLLQEKGRLTWGYAEVFR